MKRSWLLVPLVLTALGVIWILADGKVDTSTVRSSLGLRPASERVASKAKPICSQVIVPAGTDCIPQHLANLPPDPGPEDLKRPIGIDTNGNGVWDGPERWVLLNYGHSEIAVQTLFTIAKSKQLQVVHGDSLGREETQKLMPVFMDAGRCYSRTATDEMRQGKALELVQIEVANTPERFVRASKFNELLGSKLYIVADQTTAEACGFDPAALPN